MGTLFVRSRSPWQTGRERAIEKLDGAIEANAVQKTGLVQLSVETKSPTLSFQIARRLIDEVNRFNQQTRRSQAVARRGPT